MNIFTGPDGEGSSAYLRMSLPIFERLSTLFDMDFEVEEFQLLDLLQALVHKQLKMLWKILFSIILCRYPQGMLLKGKKESKPLTVSMLEGESESIMFTESIYYSIFAGYQQMWMHNVIDLSVK